MKKRTYHAKKVNKINWPQVKEQLSGEAAVFAIDIAKEKQYALLISADGAVSELLHWHHPEQTKEVLEILQNLYSPLTVVRIDGSLWGPLSETMTIFESLASPLADLIQILVG
jgi:hypothetical protein